MNITSEFIETASRCSQIESEHDLCESLIGELEDLVEKSIKHYYFENALHDFLEKEFPIWKFEAEKIIYYPEHEIYLLCDNSEFSRDDIFRIANIEVEINRIVGMISAIRRIQSKLK